MPISAPTDIAGCKLWLQGDRGKYDSSSGGSLVTSDNATVARWEDQSGQGMHFRAGSNAAVATSGVNGAISVRFNSSVLQLADGSSAPLNSIDSCTIVFALQFNTVPITTTFASWFNKGDTEDERYFFLTGGALAGAVGRYDATYGYLPTNGIPGIQTTGVVYLVTYTYLASGTDTGTETLRINGRAVSTRTGSVPSRTGTVWQLGSSNWAFDGWLQNVVMYDSCLSPTDLASIEQYVAGSIGFSTPSFGSGSILTDGDSRTFGYQSTGGQTYPAQLAAILGGSPMILNSGWSGITVQTISDNVARKYSEWNEFTGKVYVLWAGTNDLTTLGASAATVFSNLQSVYAAAKARGMHVVGCTEVGSSTGDKAGLNTLLKGAYSGGTLNADVLVDLAADSRLQDPTNTTYFADNLHPTNAGYGVIASLFAPALQSFFSPSPAILTGEFFA